MSLTIPSDAQCLTPGCPREPSLSLSLRIRRRDTSAAWAPELHAYACEFCGAGGAKVTVLFEPTGSGKIESEVVGVFAGKRRVTAIK